MPSKVYALQGVAGDRGLLKGVARPSDELLSKTLVYLSISLSFKFIAQHGRQWEIIQCAILKKVSRFDG